MNLNCAQLTSPYSEHSMCQASKRQGLAATKHIKTRLLPIRNINYFLNIVCDDTEIK